MLVGIAMTNLCLESVVMRSSLFQRVLAALHFSGGGVSPVRLMKAARAGLTMVTYLSWMVNARTSFFIVRAPAGNRIGLTLRSRWVKQHVASCTLFKAGVACCLPTCAQGSSGPVMGNVSYGVFGFFWFLLGVLCIWGVLALLVSLLFSRLGLLRCASCWTRPLGEGRWRHYLCNLWGNT